jgi:hypothetical protein
MGEVVEIRSTPECPGHEWKEEYYGWRCVHCELFFAFGCAPWDYCEDDGFDTFDGEDEYLEAMELEDVE